MLRIFSAIGMSRYTSQRAMDRLIGEMLQSGGLKGQQYIKDGALHVEIYKDMGPFQMVLRGKAAGPGSIHVFIALPAVREKRGYSFIDCEMQQQPGDRIYLAGQEQTTLEGICLSMTEVYRFYREKELWQRRQIHVSCYGLSVSGKVLLGIERTEEDIAAIQESEAWRRDMLSRAMEGDEDAIDQIQNEEDATQQEIEERLLHEDVYSIFEGFLYPAEGEDNYYTVLGDILHIDKLMNSYTEEWVYYMELDVLGQVLRVCINPKDLVGKPEPGRRFMGQVYFYGRLDPARLVLEDQNTFF